MTKSRVGIRCIGLVVCMAAASIAVAESPKFTIELSVSAGDARKAAKTQQDGAKPMSREVLKAKAGESITVRWKIANVDAKETFKDVLVHFYCAKQDKLGQTEPLKLDRDVSAESACTLDFRPKESAKGEVTIAIEKAGAYLVRIETIGAGAEPPLTIPDKPSDNIAEIAKRKRAQKQPMPTKPKEYFAVLDISVE